jgi:hypothetical protein
MDERQDVGIIVQNNKIGVSKAIDIMVCDDQYIHFIITCKTANTCKIELYLLLSLFLLVNRVLPELQILVV